MTDKTKNTLKLLLLIAYLVVMIALAFCNIVFILNQKSLVSILITGILFVLTFGGYPFLSYKLFPEKMAGKKEVIFEYIVFGIALVIFVFLAVNTNKFGLCIAEQESARYDVSLLEDTASQEYVDATEYYTTCENATFECYMTVNTFLITLVLYLFILYPILSKVLKKHWEDKEAQKIKS